MFNEAILQLFPALLSVNRVLLKHRQVHQVLAVYLAQGVEVDELLAQEQLEQLPKSEKY